MWRSCGESWKPFATTAGAAGFVALLLYLLGAGEEEQTKESLGRGEKKSSSSSSSSSRANAVQLDVDDLDPEERAALKEVSSRGYYHGRPKNEATPKPQRLETPGPVPTSAGKRTEFDEYQRKWDRVFGED
mmetsp:Transcript_119668/g.338798  ORF Transcript_119668/g.338798 Transcript_119668/m.338798 type:complete len:131 (+) Transcript_119668:117-509(+)